MAAAARERERTGRRLIGSTHDRATWGQWSRWGFLWGLSIVIYMMMVVMIVKEAWLEFRHSHFKSNALFIYIKIIISRVIFTSYGENYNWYNNGMSGIVTSKWALCCLWWSTIKSKMCKGKVKHLISTWRTCNTPSVPPTKPDMSLFFKRTLF